MKLVLHSCLIGLLWLSLSLPFNGTSGLAQAAVMSAGMGMATLASHAPFPDTQTAIQAWQQRLQQNPHSYLNYLLLSQSYLQRARETGDVSYYVKAEAAVRQAAEINPTYREIKPLLAQILYSLHDFHGALEVAKVSVDSGSIRSLATLGDVYQALGHYQEAADVYHRWEQIKPSASLYSRQAALQDVTGHFESALTLMQQATAAAYTEGYYGESLAWHEFQLGELYWKVADLGAAATHFQQALDIYPNYYLALAGLGRVAAAQEDYDVAITYYSQATAQIPQPDLLATLGDLYLITGQADQAEVNYSTVEFIGQLAEINQQVYNRQLVLFYADHDRNLDQAVDLAERELQDRQDLLGWDAAAWAHFKHHDLDQAQAAIDQALNLDPYYASIYYHAGLIAQARGHGEQAQHFLEHALALHPRFDPLQAPRAQQVLTALKNTEPSIN